MSTFTEVLSARLRHDPGAPLITFYDHVTDERVELSATTWANWVAKASSLLVDSLEVERGDTLRIDLPPHWLGTVFLGAAWNAGIVVTDEEEPDAVVCGPDSLGRWAEGAGDRVVLACSLLPLGVRFADKVPAGVHDVGVEIWSEPDAFVAWDAPTAGDVATRFEGREVTQGQMWEAAAGGTLVPGGGRLLSVANPASPPGIATVTEPLSNQGSVILVAHPDRTRLEATYDAERATARFPG